MLKRCLDTSRRGAALVVTDRRWAAPLSAAALGFGIFAGVAIGPGAAGTLAGGAQIVQLPGSGGEEGQSGGGGPEEAASTEASPFEGGGSGGEAFTSTAPLGLTSEPAPAPGPAPAPKPSPASTGEEEEDAEAEGQTLTGTVVQANTASGSYAMAIKGGELVAVHAPELPDPGTKLSVSVRRLANGTFAPTAAQDEKPPAKSASFRGVVTWASPDVPSETGPYAPVSDGTSSAFTVSGRGASILVWTRGDLPEVGAYVTVAAAIGDEGLTEKKIEAEPGPAATYLDLAAIAGEAREDGTLSLSADGMGESEAELSLAVPASIDATKIEPGDSYLATAEIGDDGSLTLKGIASDEHSKGADDAASAQGDLER